MNNSVRFTYHDKTDGTLLASTDTSKYCDEDDDDSDDADDDGCGMKEWRQTCLPTDVIKLHGPCVY